MALLEVEDLCVGYGEIEVLRGISFMIDNCSTTARLGARKWAPRFDYIIRQQAFPLLARGAQPDEALFDRFLHNDIHQVLSICAELRPPMNIAVVD